MRKSRGHFVFKTLARNPRRYPKNAKRPYTKGNKKPALARKSGVKENNKINYFNCFCDGTTSAKGCPNPPTQA